MNVESELVDQVCFKQRSRQHATAHHINIFTNVRFFQSSHKVRRLFVDEDYFLALRLLDRAREDVSLHTRSTTAATTHSLRYFISLATHHDRVDCLPHLFHDRCHFFTPLQPVDRVVFASNEVVETIGSSENSFAHGVLLHESDCGENFTHIS